MISAPLCAVALGVLLTLMGDADAYPGFQQRLPNGASVYRNGQRWPGVGHDAAAGGGALNPFGRAFLEANRSWTVALCHADSDGDGYTNGDELGDPHCVWRPGDAPARADGITHPGFADSFPATNPTSTTFRAQTTAANATALDALLRARLVGTLNATARTTHLNENDGNVVFAVIGPHAAMVDQALVQMSMRDRRVRLLLLNVARVEDGAGTPTPQPTTPAVTTAAPLAAAEPCPDRLSTGTVVAVTLMCTLAAVAVVGFVVSRVMQRAPRYRGGGGSAGGRVRVAAKAMHGGHDESDVALEYPRPHRYDDAAADDEELAYSALEARGEQLPRAASHRNTFEPSQPAAAPARPSVHQRDHLLADDAISAAPSAPAYDARRHGGHHGEFSGL